MRRGAGALAASFACLLIVELVLPHRNWEHLGPMGLDRSSATTLGHVLTAAAAIGLLAVARGLQRGSRRAAELTVSALAVGALVAVARGEPPAFILLLGALGTLLVIERGAFRRGTMTRLPLTAGAVTAATFTLAYITAMAAVLVAEQAIGLAGAAQQAGRILTGGTWWLRSGAPLSLALDVLVLATLAGAGWLLHALLRPGPAVAGHTRPEHRHAAAIVAAHASDSLDPFALRADKTFYFADGGMLAYRTLGETAVVSGDPIGPPGSAPVILAEFERHATAHGWDVVVTAASARHLEGYRAQGFRVLRIGDEAVVDAPAFTLDGGRMKTVRKAVHRVARRGWTIEIVPGRSLMPDDVAGIERVEDAWRAVRPRLQGFAMTLGRLWGAAEDEDAIYVLGRDADGALGAFQRYSPYPGGLSLDVMRRLGTDPNGVNEALIVAAIDYARDAGLGEVSLNFAGFSHLMASPGPLSRRARAARFGLRLAHGRFQLERLVRFNGGFCPRWEPRHLVYRHRLSLPRAGLRVLQAEAYVRAPRARQALGRWRPHPRPVAGHDR